MSKPSKRRDERRNKRTQKTKEKNETHNKKVQFLKRIESEKEQYDRDYPKFKYKINNAHNGFVELIKSAINKINFNDPKQFTVYERLRLRKSRLTSEEREILAQDPNSKHGFPASLTHQALLIGQKVFDFIPEDELRKWIPIHDVQFLEMGSEILVQFCSLEQEKVNGGTIYYSRYKPTLEVDSQNYIIGWTRHAIERVCERLTVSWYSYAGLGDAFAFFDQCLYYEKCKLHDNQLAFTFYDFPTFPGMIKHEIIKHILGSNISGLGCHGRVGYCPAVIEEGFIKAKTLLVPGYKTTPEYNLIRNSNLSYQEKQGLIRKTEQLSLAKLAETRDFSILKWFHDRGVPQVMQTDKNLYALPIY